MENVAKNVLVFACCNFEDKILTQVLLVISYAHKSPGNYWYGKKWFFLPKKSGEQPQGM